MVALLALVQIPGVGAHFSLEGAPSVELSRQADRLLGHLGTWEAVVSRAKGASERAALRLLMIGRETPHERPSVVVVVVVVVSVTFSLTKSRRNKTLRTRVPKYQSKSPIMLLSRLLLVLK